MFAFQQLNNWWHGLISPLCKGLRPEETVSPQPLRTGWLFCHHLPEVAQIESALIRPWTESHFRDVLDTQGAIGRVLTVPSTKKVVGYAIYELRSETCELLRVGLHPEFRDVGTVKSLFAPVKNIFELRYDRIDSVVDEYDTHTQNLLRDAGFKAIGVVKNGYQGLFEVNDAFLFSLSWASGSSSTER